MKMRTGRPAHSVLMLVALLSLAPTALFAAVKAPSKQYVFTRDTFTDKIAAWTRILGEYKGRPGVNYLEIGTFEGRSALWVLDNILTHPTAKLTIIDAFRENNYNTFISNIQRSGEAHKFAVLQGLSTPKLREVPLNSIDFAYIDGSGKGIIISSDLASTWNLVKVGGLIIISRYPLTGFLRKVLNLQPHDPGPYEAIDAFMKLYSPYISVVAFQENYVVVRKTRSAE